MKPKILVFITLAVLLLISCSSCKSEKEKVEEESTELSAEQKRKFLPPKKLPPGSAKIKTSASSLALNDENNTIQITVDKVLGYGSSSPVINKTEKISVKLSDSQKTKISSLDGEIVLVVKNIPGAAVNERTDSWKLISIE